MEEHPPADPVKLLAQWMEWERGETLPGRVMSNLKTGGLRELLEGLAATGTVGTALETEPAESTRVVDEAPTG